MPKAPRRKTPAQTFSKRRAPSKLSSPAPTPPQWRLGSAEETPAAVLVCEPMGALHERAIAGLPPVIARDLVRSVTNSPDAERTLIDTAAPSLRTLTDSARLSQTESERLLYVGRLFVVLEAAYGTDLARILMALPLARAGHRSPLQLSGSVAGLEHASTLLVSLVFYTFEAATDAPSE